MPVSGDDILKALSAVMHPDMKSDLVSLDLIRDIIIDKSNVRFNIALPNPDYPRAKELIENSRLAVLKLEGVKNVDVKIIKLDDTEKDQLKKKKPLDLTSDERLKGVKNIIAVASGKGGVGKSTIAVNLAAALAADGHSVGLLDADIYGPSIPMMLGIDEMPSQYGNKLIPVEKFNMQVISMGMFVTAGQALIWRGPMVMKAIQQFFDDVEWGELDYLIIDLPPGTGDAQLSMSQLINVSGAVIVTTPQDVAFLDVTRAIGMFQKVNVPILGIVENMSYFKCPHCNEETEIFSKGSYHLQAGQGGYPILASLPIDTKLPVSTDNGEPIVLSEPNSEIGTRLINMARKIHQAVQGLK